MLLVITRNLVKHQGWHDVQPVIVLDDFWCVAGMEITMLFVDANFFAKHYR